MEKYENFMRSTENYFVKRSNSGTFNANNFNGNSFNGPTLSFPGYPSSSVGSHPMPFRREVFEIQVHIPGYKPDEISVTTQENLIIVSGKHEHTHPELGYQSKEFTNKYTMPHNVDKVKMSCIYKDRGLLIIEAPLIPKDDAHTKSIPIKVITEKMETMATNSTSTTTTTTTTTNNKDNKESQEATTASNSTTVKTASNSSVNSNANASMTSHV